ncbi:major facilitator superfamily domain-containing protein [Fennellomyces sp. T-0311]|nr:major facilitator superfamily domain-containing protein [Fennellomyces sp. T-0311]
MKKRANYLSIENTSSSSMQNKGTTSEQQIKGDLTDSKRNEGNTEAPTEVITEDDSKDDGNLIVDRGYAWLVALGATAAFFFGGLPLSWGVIQDIYLKNDIFTGRNITVQLTLVGSLLQSIQYVGVPLCNLLYREYGPRKLAILGSILIFVGQMMTGMVTSVWQMYLSLSVCTGIGVTFVYGVSIRVLPQWFVKKRSTAFGLQASCNPFAGLILPFIIAPVYDTLGHQWIFYVLAIMSIGINTLPIAFLKDQKSSNIPPKVRNFDFTILKNLNMVIWMVAGPLTISGRLITMTFLPSHGTFVGLSSTHVAALAAVAAGMNFFGRISLGIVADQIGNVNTYLISMIITTVSIFGIWMVASDFTSLIGFAVVYGVFCGAYPVVSAPITVNIVGMERYPSATNFLMLLHSADLILPVVASIRANTDITGGDPFWIYKIMAGATYGVCALLALILKLRTDNSWTAKV